MQAAARWHQLAAWRPPACRLAPTPTRVVYEARARLHLRGSTVSSCVVLHNQDGSRQVTQHAICRVAGGGETKVHRRAGTEGVAECDADTNRIVRRHVQCCARLDAEGHELLVRDRHRPAVQRVGLSRTRPLIAQYYKSLSQCWSPRVAEHGHAEAAPARSPGRGSASVLPHPRHRSGRARRAALPLQRAACSRVVRCPQGTPVSATSSQ